jgi:hypothetical protein
MKMASLIVLILALGAQAPSSKPAVPVDPSAAIVEAARTHQLVAIKRAENRQILDLFGEDSWRISNDVGNVKTHPLRVGRRSRLSIAKSRRRRP